MPEGGLIPVRKVGNRSVTIYRYKAVRCQLLYSFSGVRRGIRRCQRGGFITVRKADNGSVIIRRYSSKMPALVFLWRVHKGIRRY
jgi:hypothetical protein